MCAMLSATKTSSSGLTHSSILSLLSKTCSSQRNLKTLASHVWNSIWCQTKQVQECWNWCCSISFFTMGHSQSHHVQQRVQFWISLESIPSWDQHCSKCSRLDSGASVSVWKEGCLLFLSSLASYLVSNGLHHHRRSHPGQSSPPASTAGSQMWAAPVHSPSNTPSWCHTRLWGS